MMVILQNDQLDPETRHKNRPSGRKKKVYFCSHLCHVAFYHMSRLWVGASESHCLGHKGWIWAREELQHITQQSLLVRDFE